MTKRYPLECGGPRHLSYSWRGDQGVEDVVTLAKI